MGRLLEERSADHGENVVSTATGSEDSADRMAHLERAESDTGDGLHALWRGRLVDVSEGSLGAPADRGVAS
jgi:hypothetical protein